jgi:GTPase
MVRHFIFVLATLWYNNSMFYDEAKVKIKAGDGGNGVVSFFRTKGITHGGPDGGDGGNGGDIFVEATNSENTLSDYNHRKEIDAENGEPGSKQRCHGKAGNHLTLKVPVGTIFFKIIDGKEYFLFDLNKSGEKRLIAKAAKGDSEMLILLPLLVNHHNLPS